MEMEGINDNRDGRNRKWNREKVADGTGELWRDGQTQRIATGERWIEGKDRVEGLEQREWD